MGGITEEESGEEEMRPQDSSRGLGRKTQEGHWNRILWS